MNTLHEIIKSLGLGLSRIIRYAFPGILLVIAIAADTDPVRSRFFHNTRESLGTELFTLGALFVGIAYYAMHRFLIIPFHHFVGTVILSFSERWIGRTKNRQDSLSPTRWLGHLRVPFFRRILAYNLLRGEFFDGDERNEINLRHAELGLIVVISEFLFAFAILRWSESNFQIGSPNWQFIVAATLFVLSAVAAMQQHRLECTKFKLDEQKVVDVISRLIP